VKFKNDFTRTHSVILDWVSQKRFASDRAQVVITGRRQAELNAAVADIGPRATGIRTDVATMPAGPPAVVARSA
jgi:NAD(P)-dependent dehydrogenase (short-subunit alcohol dehydrogenase family)